MRVQKIIKTIYNTFGYEVMAIKAENGYYIVHLDDTIEIKEEEKEIINIKLEKEDINIQFA